MTVASTPNRSPGLRSLAVIEKTPIRPFQAFIRCRHCGTRTSDVVADLGMQPIANAMREQSELSRMEPTFPLRALICPNCLLVQIEEVQSAQELFSADYTYFSSYADALVEQARMYALRSIERFRLGSGSRVVEIACNDGYLLRWFKEAGVPVAGVEPTANTAAVTRAMGIPVDTRFFGEQTARDLLAQGLSADLMPANNVVAHVPDINDFLKGFTVLLKPEGVASFEFHHVLNLLQKNQFDAIYHEHYYYHSLRTLQRILASQGLRVFDVEKIPSHGGSLRVYAQRADTGTRPATPRVESVLLGRPRPVLIPSPDICHWGIRSGRRSGTFCPT
ncbi:MAG: class I SAM-dependent methyltransferase [Burkholderiaceae bacterium]